VSPNTDSGSTVWADTAAAKLDSRLVMRPQAIKDAAVWRTDGTWFGMVTLLPLLWQWINPNDDQKEIQWKLVDDKAMEIAFEFEGKRRKQFLCTEHTM
jgi:hypothetical protein